MDFFVVKITRVRAPPPSPPRAPQVPKNHATDRPARFHPRGAPLARPARANGGPRQVGGPHADPLGAPSRAPRAPPRPPDLNDDK